eukprot:CAMPEP_0177451566 /NCGR_PEP_ID=MMETSP0369-20130122/9842_1 /TAXON_ID=447022 ORGANISM="Scrippsiella hangoei-like, Strain SHHI-4" /NCGR_SAMPLE_ID=MMETSP0369 /ASSEMBLY_ACC=CAM_ASM_000364 /LENGTH=168 /DNA_ID=CAMNT_0018924179 /DNA_START=30 /DNA_END=534 /DNA_ORIENTATION=-
MNALCTTTPSLVMATLNKLLAGCSMVLDRSVDLSMLPSAEHQAQVIDHFVDSFREDYIVQTDDDDAWCRDAKPKHAEAIDGPREQRWLCRLMLDLLVSRSDPSIGGDICDWALGSGHSKKCRGRLAVTCWSGRIQRRRSVKSRPSPHSHKLADDTQEQGWLCHRMLDV